MAKTIGAILIVLLVIIAIFILGRDFITPTSVAPTPPPSPTEEATAPTLQAENIITRTSNGFEPQSLVISQGETVVFINDSDEDFWPASTFHPTHTTYPGSDIQKCGTTESTEIFDACAALGTGETFSFIFDQVGEWGYHDHLAPSNTGSITVQ